MMRVPVGVFFAVLAASVAAEDHADACENVSTAINFHAILYELSTAENAHIIHLEGTEFVTGSAWLAACSDLEIGGSAVPAPCIKQSRVSSVPLDLAVKTLNSNCSSLH